MNATATTRIDIYVRILDERVVSRTKVRGIDVLVYVPHFVRLPDARARTKRFSNDDLLAVPAREVFAGSWRDHKHVLAVGLSDPVPDLITLDETFAEFDRRDVTTLVSHPAFLTVGLTAKDVAARRDDIDAVETYSTKALLRDNCREHGIAREMGLPGFASSYVHLRGTVDEAWTELDCDINSEAGLVVTLREKAEHRIVRHTGASHELRGMAELAYLGYENSWEKIDRFLLLGMEPTHPDYTAYDDRFDDVNVC